MGTDIQALKPADFLRILNTAGLGTTSAERCGLYTIGSERTINLLQYTAWLTLEYFNPHSQPQHYDIKRFRASQLSQDMVRAAQDIGDIPEVKNIERRTAAMESFRNFL